MRVDKGMRIELTAAIMIIFYCSVSVSAYCGGSGTSDDPFQIATAQDLLELGNDPNNHDKHFILTEDIDLDPNLPGGQQVEQPSVFFLVDEICSDKTGDSQQITADIRHVFLQLLPAFVVGHAQLDLDLQIGLAIRQLDGDRLERFINRRMRLFFSGRLYMFAVARRSQEQNRHQRRRQQYHDRDDDDDQFLDPALFFGRFFNDFWFRFLGHTLGDPIQ